jgi:oligopeptide transport system ATP-binding protein
MDEEALLDLRGVEKSFKVRGGRLMAVAGVDLVIRKGETLGLVGESGCGKTTLGRAIVKLYRPDAGSIRCKGRDIWSYSKKEDLEYRKNVQIIYQDPSASLDPLSVVGTSIAEGLAIHKLFQGHERQARVYELLGMVGLSKEHANRFPHELSGGQRQRISIARALAVEPQLIVCDEPISALDVSIQAQVVNLLMELQRSAGISYIFITHDLSMIRQIADRIAVMYLGGIVELAPSEEIYGNHRHPYTKALLSAIPIPDPEVEASRQRQLLVGDVPNPVNAPPGCSFHQRCPEARKDCSQSKPALREVNAGHFAACHLCQKEGRL